jgi:hypothetical protein
MKQVLLTGVGLAALLSSTAAAHAVDLYGWQTTGSFSSWGLVRWQDPPSGGTTRIGAASDLSFDPAFSPAGLLYGTDGSTVFTISTATGLAGFHRQIASHIFGLNEFLAGLAFSPSGTLYAWSLNSTTSGIYTINPVTGAAAVVTSNTPQTLVGMTFAPDGTLYASTGSDLLVLDPATGAVVRNLGSYPQFITSLGYGPDGVLRGLSPHLFTNGTDLYQINPPNAATTFLGSSVEDIYGIASIPAPATALMSAGLLAVSRRRRTAHR